MSEETVYIDSNAGEDKIEAALNKEIKKRNLDLKIEREQLKTGDIVYKNIVFERKSASDFLSSITDKRLKEQSNRMQTDYEYAYVILEGNPYEKREYGSNIHENAVAGMACSLTSKDISIIPSKDSSTTAYITQKIISKHEEKEEELNQVNIKTTEAETENVQLAMLMQVNGISREKAEAIIDEIRFGELASLASNVGYEDVDIAKEAVRSVDGVGEILADRVIKSFQK